MTTGLPDWVAVLTAILVLLGSILTLIGTIGLLRFKSFYARVHAPTLGTTLGIGCVLIASILYFSVLQSRPGIPRDPDHGLCNGNNSDHPDAAGQQRLHRDRDAGKDHVPPAPYRLITVGGGIRFNPA